MSAINSRNTTLAVIDGDQLLVRDQILVGRMSAAITEVALLVIFPGAAMESAKPVRVVRHQALDNVIAIGRDLANRCGLSDAAGAQWELRCSGFALIQADQLELELLLDSPSDAAADSLARSRYLDGLLVHTPRAAADQSLALAIDGKPYRVRAIGPRTGGDAVYVVTARQTQISLFAPNHRAGVDVVILADCSGSMGIADLTLAGENVAAMERPSFLQRIGLRSRSTPYITRSQAVREALLQLVEIRQRSYGSSSRMALVSFGTSSLLEFPAREGMVEIDGNASTALIQQFKDRIATLAPRNEATNIAQALQYAASHLSNHGRPGNERLIVLLSDGADWHPKGDEATGEMLDSALDDPVSLMDHLHRAMNIRLHAIGISNDALYQTWMARERQHHSNAGLAPNHTLLKELLLVGGGDAQRIGDAAVLEEYFQGLGGGVTLTVRPTTGASGSVTLSEREQAQLREKITTGPGVTYPTEDLESSDIIRLCDKFRLLYGTCNEKAHMACGFSLWNGDFVNTDKYFNYIRRPVVDEHSFSGFARYLYILLDEWLPSDIRQWKKGRELSPEGKQHVAEFLHASESLAQLTTLRNKLGAHGLSLAGKGDGASSSAATLADSLAYFIGRRHLASDDSAAWGQLKKSVLESTIGILNGIDTILESFNRTEAPTSSLTDPGESELHVIADW